MQRKGDFEKFQKLRKKYHLTHKNTAKLLRASMSSVTKWVSNKSLPLWPVLLLERKLLIDVELPEIPCPAKYLQAFLQAHSLTRVQVADIIGIDINRLAKYLYEESPCPLWAAESLMLGVLFDKNVAAEIKEIYYRQRRKELR